MVLPTFLAGDMSPRGDNTLGNATHPGLGLGLVEESCHQEAQIFKTTLFCLGWVEAHCTPSRSLQSLGTKTGHLQHHSGNLGFIKLGIIVWFTAPLFLLRILKLSPKPSGECQTGEGWAGEYETLDADPNSYLCMWFAVEDQLHSIPFLGWNNNFNGLKYSTLNSLEESWAINMLINGWRKAEGALTCVFSVAVLISEFSESGNLPPAIIQPPSRRDNVQMENLLALSRCTGLQIP